LNRNKSGRRDLSLRPLSHKKAPTWRFFVILNF